MSQKKCKCASNPVPGLKKNTEYWQIVGGSSTAPELLHCSRGFLTVTSYIHIGNQ